MHNFDLEEGSLRKQAKHRTGILLMRGSQHQWLMRRGTRAGSIGQYLMPQDGGSSTGFHGMVWGTILEVQP